MVPQHQANTDKKPVSATMEDYLEAILEIGKDKRVVRVKDIAKRMDVKMPTVSNMLKALKEKGFVDYEKYEYIELTKNGEGVGKKVQRRHRALLKFLTEILRIDFEIANGEACKVEHVLSTTTLARLAAFVDSVQTCPRGDEGCAGTLRQTTPVARIPGKAPKQVDATRPDL